MSRIRDSLGNPASCFSAAATALREGADRIERNERYRGGSMEFSALVTAMRDALLAIRGAQSEAICYIEGALSRLETRHEFEELEKAKEVKP